MHLLALPGDEQFRLADNVDEQDVADLERYLGRLFVRRHLLDSSQSF